MKKLLAFTILALTLQACKNKKESSAVNNKNESVADSLHWKKMKCGLYINKNGEIGIKDFRAVGKDHDIEEYYLTEFADSLRTPFNKIIDTATFKELGNTFYQDKNHIYRFYGMAKGGSFYFFDEADYKTFHILGDFYAKDKNHIYEMRKGKLDSVDYKTFKTCNGCGPYSKDKNGYYRWGDKVDLKNIDDGIEAQMQVYKIEKL